MAERSRKPRPLRVGYTVGEAAQLAGVSLTTVRSWEREGLISATRSASGYRYFDEAEIERLRRITYLRHVEKLNLAGIVRVLADDQGGRRPRPRREVNVGARLRRLRRERGLTLEQAAAGAGVSASFLSLLERDHTGVSVANLRRLLNLYGTTMADLAKTDRPRRTAQLRRAGRDRAIHEDGVRIEHRAQGDVMMDPDIFTVEPGAGSGGSYTHEGEEFLYVLEGVFEVVLRDDERYRLRQGDSLYYPSTVPHAWRNPGEVTARLLWVNAPPTF
jgi:DNA-binding transcriptional MerR regulator/mannose-6-phosphate isomerase-like protein (cupin superfamily)